MRLIRWIARDRLHIGYYWTFFARFTAEAKVRRNRPLLKGVGHFEAKHWVEGLCLPPTVAYSTVVIQL